MIRECVDLGCGKAEGRQQSGVHSSANPGEQTNPRDGRRAEGDLIPNMG